MAFEENNTANILLCLSSTTSGGSVCLDNSKLESDLSPSLDSSTSMPLKGNLIDQIRHKVRSEAAEVLNKSRSNASNPFASSSSGSDSLSACGLDAVASAAAKWHMLQNDENDDWKDVSGDLDKSHHSAEGADNIR